MYNLLSGPLVSDLSWTWDKKGLEQIASRHAIHVCMYNASKYFVLVSIFPIHLMAI